MNGLDYDKCMSECRPIAVDILRRATTRVRVMLDIEDLCQHGLMACVAAMRDYDARNPQFFMFARYSIRMAMLRCVDLMVYQEHPKRDGVRGTAYTSMDDVFDTQDKRRNPIKDIDDKDYCEWLTRQLRGKDHTIISMRFFDGLEDAEIAEQLEVTRQAVNKRIAKIINRLASSARNYDRCYA